MRKSLTIFVAALLIAGSFCMQSCEKCTTCSYTYTGPGGNTLTYDYPELCGNKSDINDLQDLCAATAAGLTNGNCTCVDD